MKLKLTKSAVDSIKRPASGQELYYDTLLIGFGLRATQTARTFFAESRVAGKTVRVKIGRFGPFTVEQARSEAQQLLARMARGENPNEEKKPQFSEITLKTALDDYVKQRQSGQGRQIKNKTAEGYRWFISTPLAEWLDKPIASITESMVREKHKTLTHESGPACANSSMRVLSRLIKFGQAASAGSIKSNPVDCLTSLGLWNEDKRRKRHVASAKMEAWLDAVESIDEIRFPAANRIRGALYVMMFLGFRSTETLTIKTGDICDGVLELPDTKNGVVHRVPLGPWLGAIVEALRLEAVKLKKGYLFWSEDSKTGHLVNMRKPMTEVAKAAGVPFSPHDLRRSFVSLLNVMEPAPSAYTIKRLLNHKAKPADVTAGYIQIEEKQLKSTITRLEAWILSSGNRSPQGLKLTPSDLQTTTAS